MSSKKRHGKDLATQELYCSQIRKIKTYK